jgi:hypothetical protein
MSGARRPTAGDWYAVPLRRGLGYGLALVARANPTGSFLIGYFFGPVHRAVPTFDDTAHCRPEDAVLVALFGMGDADWPHLGRDPAWRPEPRETTADIEAAAQRLPQAGYFGPGAVEIVLTQRLAPLETAQAEEPAAADSRPVQEDGCPRTDQSTPTKHVTYFAQFTAEKHARRVVPVLHDMGFEVQVIQSEDPDMGEAYWSLLAHHVLPSHDEGALARLSLVVERIVHAAGGSFDGHERDV